MYRNYPSGSLINKILVSYLPELLHLLISQTIILTLTQISWHLDSLWPLLGENKRPSEWFHYFLQCRHHAWLPVPIALLGFTALDIEGLTLLLRDCHMSRRLNCSLLFFSFLLEAWDCQRFLHIDSTLLLIGQTGEKTHMQSLRNNICTSISLNLWILAPEDWKSDTSHCKGGRSENIAAKWKITCEDEYILKEIQGIC